MHMPKPNMGGVHFRGSTPCCSDGRSFSPLFRRPLPGRLSKFLAGFRHLVRQRCMRQRNGSNRRKSVRIGGSPPCCPVDGNPNSARRLSLRRWLRPSLPLSLRGQVEAIGRYPAPQAGLRACCPADIPTPLPNQNKTKEVYVMFSLNPNLNSASLALDACANTSALVRQRFSITSPITGSALLSQHLTVNRSRPWGSA